MNVEFEEDIEPKHRSKKNTRKWCKGKVGVEHVGKWTKTVKWTVNNYYQKRCIHCNKVLEYWWDSKWLKNPLPADLKELMEKGLI